MNQTRPLEVVFCWHMHQPQYRRARDGWYRLPWTYLHALKDYADMAWHLEQVPEARAVINFTPVLLDQLEDYGEQFATRAFRDPLLCALDDPAGVSMEQRPVVIADLFRAHQERMLARFAPYARLRSIFDAVRADDRVGYLSDGYLGDLAVWYHLAWLGESIRRSDVRAARLMQKGQDFDRDDRQALIGLLGDAVRAVIPRYRTLAERGHIELSTSPHSHPIVPLLVDFNAARESQPDAALPETPEYPGGVERARAHLDAALRSHRARFGESRVGCWPSEGGISKAAAGLFADAGFAWTASCETVLVNALRHREAGLTSRADYLCHPYRIGEGERALPCFFRDVHLSDLIGFRYAEWHADDAAAHFVGELEEIDRSTADQPAPVVSIILDGENAWEHYPENGYYFLSALYRAVAANPNLRFTTFSEYLTAHDATETIDDLVAGSWVYGTFSTWIGDAAKNRAWDLLSHAKRRFDEAMASGGLSHDERARAEAQLKTCEGSDWFWWFGPDNPAETVSAFDRLFREHLADLYDMMGAAPPEELERVISTGSADATGDGTMRENLGA